MVTHIKKTMVGNKLYLLGFIVVFDVKNSKYIYRKHAYYSIVRYYTNTNLYAVFNLVSSVLNCKLGQYLIIYTDTLIL